MLFHERLRYAMSLRGVSARKLSDAASIPYSSLLTYTGGSKKPGLDALIAMIKFLAVSSDWFLFERGSIDPVATNVNQEAMAQAAKAILKIAAKKSIPDEKVDQVIYLLYEHAKINSKIDDHFITEIGKLL